MKLNDEHETSETRLGRLTTLVGVGYFRLSWPRPSPSNVSVRPLRDVEFTLRPWKSWEASEDEAVPATTELLTWSSVHGPESDLTPCPETQCPANIL